MRRSPPSSASPATSPSTPPAGGAPAARSKKSPTKSSASRTSCSAAPSRLSTTAIDDGRGGRIRTCKSFRTEHFKCPADPSFATPPLLVPARVNGGGGENRTHEYGFCRPAPYHLATPPRGVLERETGFEPATPTLARSCSTTELFPPARQWNTRDSNTAFPARPPQRRISRSAAAASSGGTGLMKKP